MWENTQVTASTPDRDADDVEALIDAWVNAQESPHTRTAYRRDVSAAPDRMKVPGWVPWCERQSIDPLAARRRDVDSYKQALKQAAYSPTSIARRLAAVSSWYDYLLDERAVDDNPAKSVKRPRIDRNVSNAVGLSEDELNRLFNVAAADGPRSEALVSVLFFGGGLRVGSVCNANVGDLGWNEGVRTIKLTVKGGEIVREPLDEMAAEALDAYLAERGQAAKKDPLFVRTNGERLDSAFIWREVRRLAKAAGVLSWDQLSPHSLRHTFATHALDEGASLVDLQDQMGHRSMDTTRRYDRARGKRERQPSRLLADRRRRYLAEQNGDPSPATDTPKEVL
jgi:integrase/recombinase XerD